MKPVLRNDINKLGLTLPGCHAGLALHRFLENQPEQGAKFSKDKPHPYAKLAQRIADWEVPKDYKQAYQRWREALQSMNVVWIEATTLTPLAVGLGNSSPIENGLAIHHTYGTPYLPGSAIKGLLRRAADKYNLSEEQKGVLFGEGPDPKRKSQGSAAHLVYWDGWLDPKSDKPYQQDVITVHHPDYYKFQGKDWPTDFDDPNPVTFLSVKPGVKFCLALSSASETADPWLNRAAEMLEWGLANLGLGGKTNAGYGYFGDFKRIVPERAKTQLERIAEVDKETQAVLSQTRDASSLSKIDDYLPKLERLESLVRKSSLEAIKSHLTTMKRWDLEKSRCQKIQALLEE